MADRLEEIRHEVRLKDGVYRLVNGHLEITFASDGKTVPQKPSAWDHVEEWIESARLHRRIAENSSGGVALFGHCSRCLEAIKDFEPPGDGMTAGYYVAAAWGKYANPGEVYICDACMWADARYIADYGPRPLPSRAPEEPSPPAVRRTIELRCVDCGWLANQEAREGDECIKCAGRIERQFAQPPSSSSPVSAVSVSVDENNQ